MPAIGGAGGALGLMPGMGAADFILSIPMLIAGGVGVAALGIPGMGAFAAAPDPGGALAAWLASSWATFA